VSKAYSPAGTRTPVRFVAQRRLSRFNASFFGSQLPILVSGLCIAQLGGDSDGAIVAYDLATGNEKWKWTGDMPGYGSPVLVNVEGTQVIVAPTDKNMVAIDVATGNSCGKFLSLKAVQRSHADHRRANAHLRLAGTTAEKLTLASDGIKAEQLWNNPDASVVFNTPVLKDGLIFGLTANNQVFCVREATGKRRGWHRWEQQRLRRRRSSRGRADVVAVVVAVSAPSSMPAPSCSCLRQQVIWS